MGNTQCCCCASDEGARKDKDLDAYLNKYDRDPLRVAKCDKKDYLLAKQDFKVSTYKAQKNMEILDEKARRQDMQTPESINLSILSDVTNLTNANSSNPQSGTRPYG